MIDVTISRKAVSTDCCYIYANSPGYRANLPLSRRGDQNSWISCPQKTKI